MTLACFRNFRSVPNKAWLRHQVMRRAFSRPQPLTALLLKDFMSTLSFRTCRKSSSDGAPFVPFTVRPSNRATLALCDIDEPCLRRLDILGVSTWSGQARQRPLLRSHGPAAGSSGSSSRCFLWTLRILSNSAKAMVGPSQLSRELQNCRIQMFKQNDTQTRRVVQVENVRL